MESLPAVASVEVGRRLPSTLELTVTVREPLAVVEVAGELRVIDADGVPYDTVARPAGLPVLRARTDIGRSQAREVLLSLPSDLRSRVRRVSAGTRDDVTLHLTGGAVVRWGSSSDAALKARVLAGLMAVGADRYDVSAPLHPTTRGGVDEEKSTLND
jgi:cell division protein FtsQ